MRHKITTTFQNWVHQILLLALISFSGQELSAQNDIPIGTWRSHFSYFSAQEIAFAGNRIYCATKNGFFYYDQGEESTTILSKVNGLSDTGISALGVDKSSNTLIIGYENGNIDLLNNNVITNFSLIKEADVLGSKNINSIFINASTAYISADAGLLVFNLNRIEITETYTNIGPNGAPVLVYASTIFNDSLFVATDLGVLGASLDPTVNRLDFRNWRNFEATPGIGTSPVKTIDNFQGALYAGVDNDSIYLYDGDQWQGAYFLGNAIIQSSFTDGNRLIYALSDQLLQINNANDIESITNQNFREPKSIILDANGNLWVADNKNGLVQQLNGNFKVIRPNGPFSDQVQKMISYNGKIVAVPGGIQNDLPLGNEAGFYEFKEGTWSNYNTSGLGQTITIPIVKDLIDITYNAITGITYFASFGYGILSWDNAETFEIINENTPGSTLINSNPLQFLTRVSSLSIDFEGNLWLCNYGTDRPLQVLKNDDSWAFFQPDNSFSKFSTEIIIPASNQKWMKVDPEKGGTIVLYDDQLNLTSRLSRSGDEGALPGNQIFTAKEDLSGQVWIGTSIGLVYFPTSFELLEEVPKPTALTPIFEGFDLLSDQKITKIAIDGGNRKWVGTDQGVWLFEENGEALVFNFTEENSPLPSNNIQDIAINDVNGEVFIATDNGLVSFRSTATAGKRNHDQVKVFPNPVTRSFNGTIGISGLVNNANVKITDISGKLIFETRAQGGTATWNARDYNNRRASTGIYLILSTNDSGEEKFIGKIAIID